MKNNKNSSAERALKQFTGELQIDADELLQTQFALVSAGLRNYLPNILHGQHLQIFKEIFYHQQLSNREQSDKNLCKYIQLEGFSNQQLKELREGAIIGTFHMGSYRAINVFLINKNIPFSIVINDQMFQKESGDLRKIFEKHRTAADPFMFDIINAEDANALIKMIRCVKSGRTLLIYIDGNTGIGSINSSNSNCCDIPFLSQRIYARSGIAYLSMLSGKPIIPVISYRKTLTEIHLRFYQSLNGVHFATKKEKQKEAFRIMKELYGKLESIVELYPQQWESWLYLHKMANIEPRHEVKTDTNINVYEDALIFNKEDFSLFNAGAHLFLFNKWNYEVYPIDKKLYQQLQDAAAAPIEAKLFAEDIVNELLGYKVLMLA